MKELSQEHFNKLLTSGCKAVLLDVNPEHCVIIPAGWFVCTSAVGDASSTHIVTRRLLTCHPQRTSENLAAIRSVISDASATAKVLTMLSDIIKVSSPPA